MARRRFDITTPSVNIVLIVVVQGKDIDEQVDATLDRLLVEFGKEILKIVPGKVSTEVDAKLSFDKDRSLEKARHIIEVSCGLPIRHALTSG